MKNKVLIILQLACFLLIPFFGMAQINTFSPYSRYGLGELAPTTFAHNSAMGGACIALKPDSTMPIFINAGNPAAYSLIRLTSLEVGGSFVYSKFTSNGSTLNKWTTNFSYGALGFPVRGNGGACFGIMPFSNVGYDTQNTVDETGIGNVNYKNSGSGGLNKAFIGYGIAPFNKRLIKFRSNYLYVPDSLKLSKTNFKIRAFGSKLLSDFSLGFNVNYIFGNIQNLTRAVYPNSQLYNNTYRERDFTMGDFTGNFGMQTAITIDSIIDRQKRHIKIDQELTIFKEKGTFTESDLQLKRDSLAKHLPTYHRALKEKVKFTFGYFMGLNNTLKVNYNSIVYNYSVDGFGQEFIRDTVLFKTNQAGTIKLPLEQGFGIGFKKGDKLNVVSDFAITNWQNFKYLDAVNEFKNNYRVALGLNFVPEKYAAGSGAFFKRINYRFGVSYQTGYIDLKNTLLSNYSISAGLGLPVGIGRLSSMVNISGQYGQMGTSTNGLIKENYWRINFGFTFSDRWFQKFKYD